MLLIACTALLTFGSLEREMVDQQEYPKFAIATMVVETERAKQSAFNIDSEPITSNPTASTTTNNNNNNEEAEDDDDEQENYGELEDINDDDGVSQTTKSPTTTTTPLRDGRIFGKRHQHRTAHAAARESGKEEFLEFDPNLVLPQFRDLPILEVEAEYFRFRDKYGLIDTGFTDDEIIYALQRLVNIYAKANVRIRIRPKEALAYVDLSDDRAKAYWYYVDFPKGDLLSPAKRARKEIMEREIGKDLIAMFDRVYSKDRNGLLDWVLGFPLERTRWEQRNVVALYPVYFYYYMNGGGETNCMRFRAGDCSRPKQIQNVEGGNLKTMCYHFQQQRNSENEVEDHAAVRPWEKQPFTLDMAVRLIAHEMGHALKLQHPTGKCVELKKWSEGNLMNQVRKMTLQGEECTKVGFPDKTVNATVLWPVQCEAVRNNIHADLRQTPVLPQQQRLGNTLETLARVMGKDDDPLPVIFGFMAQTIDFPRNGTVKRVSWKSANRLDQPIKISIGSFDPSNNMWIETASQLVEPHSKGAHLHQEHEVDLPIVPGLFVAVLGQEDLAPETQAFDNPHDYLIKDLSAHLHKREVVHLMIDKVINAVDAGRIPIKRARIVRGMLRMTPQQEWKPLTTTDWIINVDFE